MFYSKMTKEELELQIANETLLIEQLEKSYPPFIKVNGDGWDKYQPENKTYIKHLVEVQDAYWRRRMCQSAINSLNMSKSEKDKLLQSTARVY